MKFLAFLLTIVFFMAPMAAIAYPQDDLTECILSAKSNPNILGVPENSIEKFCDCALTLILDEELDLDEAQSSINKCASKHFG